MKLHILGSAGYHPNGFRETTCMMIPELGIVLDAGSGFYRVRGLLDQVPKDLPLQTFISHGHIDHTIGLTYAINVLWRTDRRANVIGDAKHCHAIEHQLFNGPLFPLAADHPFIGYTFDRLSPSGVVTPGASEANGVRYSALALPHPGGSTGFRLSLPNGRDLVYITDACADDVPTEFVKGAHTLIHECNFTDNLATLAKNSGHSTTSQVFNLAKRAGVERLVCMHWNTMIELVAGHPIKDMTGRDPFEKLPFELVLADDHTVIEL
jgi:ribonuclease BN (tRNA processing enzyme)